ncbi:MAG: hypothetical protein M1828_007458 [Chrysothrix sp. TS-e1954]|nr:MAG: hypothetical protein M1828_007458 [Chrysothrix sp. TS-e1954]
MEEEDTTEVHGGQDAGNSLSRHMGRLSWVTLCSAILLAVLQTALDVTMTANLQPAIFDTLGDIEKFTWINVAYSLANAGSSLLWGKLFDIFDKKRVLLSARVLFAVGSIVTGAASSMNMYIAGKVISGTGGSGAYLGSISILSALTSSKEKSRYFSYIGVMWGMGTIIGPLISGAFTVSEAGWRWSYYFNAILVGVTLPALAMLIPPHYRSTYTHSSFWNRCRHLDVVGFLLYAGALVSTVMVLVSAGLLYPWGSAQVIGLFCSAGCLWILFYLQQTTTTFTTKYDRLLPVHVLGTFEKFVLTLQVICPFSVVFVTIAYMPLYLQFVRGETAIRSAVHMLPFLVFTVVSMLASGRLVTVYGYYKVWFLAGSSTALISLAFWYTVSESTDHGYLYILMIFTGTGVGLYGMSPGAIMAAKVPPEYAPDTGTIFGAADVLCGALSVAVANAIFINRATKGIRAILPNLPTKTVQEAIVGVGNSFVNDLPPDQRQGVIHAVVAAIRDVWAQLIATAALSFLLAVFMRAEKLHNQ